ncbi:MAG: hypothetical protein IJX28_07790 [Clostridia bacterium]|nr:hypothetical protein [Clostridia bacterium]
MYQISVPVMNATVTSSTREEYLRQFLACEASRVFLVPDTDINTGEVRDLELLKENLAFFSAHGVEGAIWVGETVGHGGLTHDAPKGKAQPAFVPLVNFDGARRPGTVCPLDTSFQERLKTLFTKLAATGAKLILIDDDFRLSQHGKDSFCCLCPLHVERINQRCGEVLTREELRDRIFHGKPNPYRDAYLQESGDSLRHLARVLRSAVDAVDPSVGLALCSCHCVWDSDGTDPIELTHLLKGNHPPVLRLQGAPYWAVLGDKKLPTVFEIARMMASFCKDTGFELMSECDAYPRPRYHVPASLVELQDALIRADGSIGTSLKYMFDYTASPFYETGYVERHVRDLPLLKETGERFAAGEQVGVRIVIRPHLLKDSDCDLITPKMASPYPTAGVLMGYCTIPTTYTGRALCSAAFGQNSMDLSREDLDGGVILDAAGAILLTEKGVDVGLDPRADLRGSLISTIATRCMTPDGEERALLLNGGCRLLTATPRAAAEPLLSCVADGTDRLLCYRYENSRGQRFLVYLFEATSLHRDSGLLQGYLVQQATTRGVEWISRRPLPVKCMGHPQLYLLCKEEDDRLTVGLFNCHADSIYAPTLTLDRDYQRVECLRGEGVLDHRTLTLSELPAYSWTAVTLTR